MRLAILFSGQGHQQSSHLDALREGISPELATVLAKAIPTVWEATSSIAGEIQVNSVAQPLIFGYQMKLWQQLQSALPRPVCVAGYSLGEMAACCVAGAFPVVAGLDLCTRRAELMDSCMNEPAGLLAVLGLGAEAVAELASQCGLAVAIRNAPDNFVLGGRAHGLVVAERLAKAAGAKRVVRLAVSTPSHTPLLAAASVGFAAHLHAYREGRLAFPVLSAIDGRAVHSATDGMDSLARQISTPLDWEACLSAVLEMQPDVLLEIGPGNALARMWSERGTGVPVRASADFQTVAGIVDWVRQCD